MWETYCKDGRSAGDSREWGEVKAVGRRGGWGCIAGVEWRSRERHTGADLWWLYYNIAYHADRMTKVLWGFATVSLLIDFM